MLASDEKLNDFVNNLRGEVRAWREGGNQGAALVTRRLLEWWFERDEERMAIGEAAKLLALADAKHGKMTP